MSSGSPAADLESVASTNNGENFSLSEFFRTEATTLLGRVKPFSEYYRASRTKGLAHYGREIVSAISNRVRVRGIDGTTREMVMFGSNNYLGLTTHPHVLRRIQQALEEFGAGVGGPPLLGGMTQLHM
jgi:glycine C-acetyltransferase